MNKMLAMPAFEVVSLLKEKQISPVELIGLAEQRIQQVDPQINAVPTLCVDRAMQHARKMVNRSDRDIGPHDLYGLPILVKDLTEVAGVRTTYGSPVFKDYIPSFSNYAVKTLEENGAIVIGKTNTPEFGAGGNTFNEVFGVTKNPWNTSLTSGGSSGGSAAALAAGEIWLATGNDLAGSLRTPAGFCSVVGFRPSPGRVAAGPGPSVFNPLAVEGPMGRCVKDVALMLDAQVGYHSGDPLSLESPEYSFFEMAGQEDKTFKVAASIDLGGITPVQQQVVEVFEQSVKKIGTVMDVNSDCPDIRKAPQVFHTLRAQMLAQRYGTLLEKKSELFKPDLVWNIKKGMQLSLKQTGRAEQLRARIYQNVVDFFKTYDVLICPTSAVLPFDASIASIREIEGVGFDNYLDWLTITFAITVTACPVITIPCGFSRSGLPVGMQIIGPPRRDDIVIQAASIFEKILGLEQQVPIDPKPAI